MKHEFIVKRGDTPVWVLWIARRLQRNQNCLLVIVGQTGSGKSYSSLSIMELVSQYFGKKASIENVCFDGLSLHKASLNAMPNTVFILEEAQVVANRQRWYDTTNQCLARLFSTFRVKNFVVILNLPNLSRLDKSIFELLHAKFETVSIDYQNKKVKLQCHRQYINPSDLRGKPYFPFLRMAVPGKPGVRPVKYWNVPKPSDELIKAYEEKKASFLKELELKLIAQLEEAEDKAKKKKEQPLTDNQQEVMDLLNEGWTVKEIAKQQGVSPVMVRIRKKALEKKGYLVIPKREKDNVVKYRIYKKGDKEIDEI